MRKWIAGLLIAPSVAMAEFWDGNSLLQRMNSDNAHERVQAMGYVMGVHDVFSKVSVCSPQNITVGQLRDLVKDYLERNPAIRHYSADSLAVNIMKQTWPCPSKGRGV